MSSFKLTGVAISPVVLCGGNGNRLWPISQEDHPKQFLDVLGVGESLMQSAIKRANSLSKLELPCPGVMVVGSERHSVPLQSQLQQMKGINIDRIILEPVGRNTAAALTITSLAASSSGDDPVLIAMPSDHIFLNENMFLGCIETAIRSAEEGDIVLLGAEPDRPDTSYGYIKTSAGDVGPVLVAEEFLEKPNRDLADKFIIQKTYLWNMGIFVLRASTWLRAIEEFREDIAITSRDAWESRNQIEKLITFSMDRYQTIPAESVDHAVMEKALASDYDIRVVKAELGWSDLGGWEAVRINLEHDVDGNATFGKTLQVNSKSSLLYSTTRPIVTLGVKDIVAVETENAVFVSQISSLGEMRKLLHEFEKNFPTNQSYQNSFLRPWGRFEILISGETFKAKRITVNPGQSLSLQKHNQRSEHWVVVRGVANVLVGEDKLILATGESIDIGVGVIHRLANYESEILEVFEVQFGDYLGEDDIERFDDMYGRA